MARESFASWRDSSTGINPFLPAYVVPSESSAPARLVYSIVCLAFGAIRLALLYSMAMSWILWSVLLCPFLSFRWARMVDYAHGFIIMRCLGYSRIEEGIMTLKADNKGGFTAQKTKSSPPDGVEPGDLIIANHSSYIDIIYLRMAFSAAFTLVSAYPPHKARPCSLWTALFGLDRSKKFSDAVITKDLGGELKKVRRPVVVFPEGTRSNGKALLKFVADLSEIAPNQRIHLVSLRHENFGNAEVVSPAFPIFSLKLFVSHLSSQLCQWGNWLVSKRIPPAAFYGLASFPSPSRDPVEAGKFRQALEDVMAEELLKKRRVAFNMVDKLSFLRTYFSSSKSK